MMGDYKFLIFIQFLWIKKQNEFCLQWSIMEESTKHSTMVSMFNERVKNQGIEEYLSYL